MNSDGGKGPDIAKIATLNFYLWLNDVGAIVRWVLLYFDRVARISTIA
jgi:hypothetical protein